MIYGLFKKKEKKMRKYKIHILAPLSGQGTNLVITEMLPSLFFFVLVRLWSLKKHYQLSARFHYLDKFNGDFRLLL